MAINPNAQYPGKVSTPSTNYPYGGAQNITAPGDGTGTPWESALVNDMFGMQQRLLGLMGITPSGTPDNAVNAQYVDAMWGLNNVRTEEYTMVADANYTLTAEQNLHNRLVISATPLLITAPRDIIIDNVERVFTVEIDPTGIAFAITFKTATGTGVAVAPGATVELRSDGTDVVINATAVTAQNGEAPLPGGVILKWGVHAADGGVLGRIFFPVAFPNECFLVFTSDSAVTTDSIWTIVTSHDTLYPTDFGWFSTPTPGVAVPTHPGNFMWFAIGY